jgi:hypothetical protein
LDLDLLHLRARRGGVRTRTAMVWASPSSTSSMA